ncbi:MAG: hypothetical protein ACRDVG_15840, partial [Jatrophihabitantaceae bacterium]
TPLPSAGRPVLAMVLTPRDPHKPTWVFPFNRPGAPGAGGNQAMAINTTDGSTVYDVAFALVYADTDTVLNRNEAYAFASCTNCAAVAIAFQVVLIVGDAHVIAPQNISAAVSYNCLRCVTAALAIQLDVSLTGPPGADTAARLQVLFAQIKKFGHNLQGLTFSQIHAQLVAYEKQLLTIVAPYAKQAQPAATSGAAGSSVAPGASVGSGGAPVSPSGTAGGPPTSSSGAPTSAAVSSSSAGTSPDATSSPPGGTAPSP